MTSTVEKGDRRSDAAALAGGSSWVFLGALFEGGLRFVITWYLSGALGAEDFGIYTFAVTLVTVVSLASPLGVNIGAMYFGARWLQARDRPRLKGYLLGGFGVVLAMGPTMSLALVAMGMSGRFWQDKPGVPEAVSLIAPSAAIMGLLLYLVFAIRAAKDMKRSTIAMQMVVPGALLIGTVIATKANTGLQGVIVAFLVANAIALMVAAVAAWRHFGTLLRNGAVRPVFELRRLLEYSLPQAVPAIMYRINLQLDIMMLLMLGTAQEVGIYRVAVSLVVMVIMPVGAMTTMFSPQVAQLYHAGEIQRLDALLKVATRWLVIIVAPIYLVLVLEHRLILTAFDEEYMASAAAVLVLAAGQSIHALSASASRLIPMSGRSVLDMSLSLVAVGLNVTLNFLLIPEYGGLGAAISGAVTFALWGVSRIVVAYWITHCHPFTWRTIALLLGVVTLGGVCWVFAPAPVLPHLFCTTFAVLGFAGLAATIGRTPQDTELLAALRVRLVRMVGVGR